jgi:N-carbamoylputrescine amidase
VLVEELQLDEMRTSRHGWPFFRDRRIDAYGSITERYIDKT